MLSRNDVPALSCGLLHFISAQFGPKRKEKFVGKMSKSKAVQKGLANIPSSVIVLRGKA